MSCRRLPLFGVLAVALAATSVVGQSAVNATAAHRTAWGDPDLQGTWTSSGATPMERPDEFRQ